VLAAKGVSIKVWNRQNKYGWTPLTIAEGHPFGNFKPSAVTVAPFNKVMRAAGIIPLSDSKTTGVKISLHPARRLRLFLQPQLHVAREVPLRHQKYAELGVGGIAGGSPRGGVLVAVKDSARNSSRYRSVKLKRLDSIRSSCGAVWERIWWNRPGAA
jgi:hypothetical protein